MTFDCYTYPYSGTMVAIGPASLGQGWRTRRLMAALQDADDRGQDETGDIQRPVGEQLVDQLHTASKPAIRRPVNHRYRRDARPGPSGRPVRPAGGREPGYLNCRSGTNAQTLYAFVSHPMGMIASDAILFGEYPNPRTYGCFPIVLAEFVRAEKHLSLPEAIRKMTSFPAQRLGIPDRGLLRDGFKADIVAVQPIHGQDPRHQGRPSSLPGGHRLRDRQRPGGD